MAEIVLLSFRNHDVIIFSGMNAEMIEKVKFFSEAVRSRLGRNVISVYLFGSRARGDYQEGSDYDFVVIVHKRDKQTRGMLDEAGVAFLDCFDELAACLVYDKEEWETTQLFPIGINIKREGILV